jgi:hypothetical protein
MKPRHFLGPFRAPLILIIGVLVGVLVWHSSQIPMRGLLWGAVGIAFGWVATTEVAIKFLMSAFVAAIGAYVAHIVMTAAYPTDKTKALSLIYVIVPGVVGLFLGVVGYAVLDSSSWIGIPCPFCGTRGRTSREITKKDYHGQKAEREGDNIVTYNLYHVTHKNWCNSCGKQWITTEEARVKAKEKPRLGSRNV